MVNARTARSVPEASLETIERLGIALGDYFHTAVWRVPHPPEDPFAPSGRLGEVPEADTLHAAADQVSPRDDHEALSYRNNCRIAGLQDCRG